MVLPSAEPVMVLVSLFWFSMCVFLF